MSRYAKVPLSAFFLVVKSGRYEMQLLFSKSVVIMSVLPTSSTGKISIDFFTGSFVIQ